MNNQTATGRKRSSKNVQKKKKQPQRGMGVEQLERLRMQDTIKKTIPHQYYSNNFYNFTTLSPFNGTISATASATHVADPGIYNSILNSSPVLQFPKLCVTTDFFAQQKVVNNSGLIGSSSTVTGPTGPAVAFGNQLISSYDHQFQSQNMGLYGFATNFKPSEQSKEPSSMPNFMNSNNKSCFSERCLSCNKKKRTINGKDMSIHMDHMVRENENFGKKPLLRSRIEKGVEIVAFQRKGGSSSTSEEGPVVMKYDFFPEKSGSNTTNNTSCFWKIMSNNSSPESSSVAAAVGNINGEASCVTTISWADTITTPTSSIDLSLKLSC
ncbi:hypothetical protein K7X08_005486 [Anisodus acutangulus]|uniref:Uncharacterized protein n=1 Tax=Anisodus acutangulus TaxID=402998 RepID=A0A9Q1LUM4_9SOLA|nr:hypothetical protein K7X08_005486 [Anisodus acutangulus]